MKNTTSHILLTPLVAMLFGLSGCGNDLSGVYSGADTGFLDQIEFKNDNKVELMFMGTIKEGTYEVEDGKVRINNGGEITIFTIDDAGCLQGGGILGSYCKGGGKPGSTSSRGDSSSSVVGHTFAGGPAGDEMVLEFLDEDRVRMEIDGEYEQLRYDTRGSQITIHGVDGRSLVLTQRGKDLEGGPDGMVIVFRRR